MADITVRNIRFSFEDSLPLDLPADELAVMVPQLALSMTMPYLEPYLIRNMKLALKQITDPELSEDVRRFSQQEGHHFRNHAMLNDRIRARFDADTADRLRAIEADLQHLVGSYPYRILVGTWSQWHYIRYIARFAGCLAKGLERKVERGGSAMNRAALRRYLHTWSPWYDPAKVDVPAGVDALLARYSALAESGSS